jgi:hypothetical protein
MNISEYTDKKDNVSIEDSTVWLKGKVLQSTEAKEVRFEHLVPIFPHVPHHGRSTTESSTSRFTIHLLNCYSFGANIPVTN